MIIEVTPDFAVAPQLTAEAFAVAKSHGCRAIINNRPDHEEPGQPEAAELAAVAAGLGLGYAHIPVGRDGLSPAMMEATNAALAAAGGPVLAFCRSGTRSITLWAYARAAAGDDPAMLVQQAAAAGYDLRGHAGALAALAQGR